jgi:hypothetical protein
LLQVLKDFKVPAATLGVQVNPDPATAPYTAAAAAGGTGVADCQKPAARLDVQLILDPANIPYTAAIAAAAAAAALLLLLLLLLQVLKDFKVPAATLGVQVNPDPASVAYNAPTVWRNGQYWLMYGFGMSYKAPMRVAR